MRKKLFPIVLTLALAIGATAADTKQPSATVPGSAPAVSKGPKRYPYHANVAAIDVTAKTVTLDGKKKQRVLHITPTTRILKEKKPVALETINVGDYITGSLVDTEGRLEPTTVNVGGTAPKDVAKTTPTTTPGATIRVPPPQKASINVVKPGQPNSGRKP